jgi:hypothetical protein
MTSSERKLTKSNVGELLKNYANSVETIGASIQGQTGRTLLESLKRGKVGVGPYPDVTLFEAANRIMTDLVIYTGVKWLLDNETFPFTEYTVELGNEDNNGFDIRAEATSKTLIGEAFNVAPSFFQGKKGAMLKKLKKNGKADYKIIMVNHDAVLESYAPAKEEAGVYYVIVNVGAASAKVVPNKALQATPKSGAPEL